MQILSGRGAMENQLLQSFPFSIFFLTFSGFFVILLFVLINKNNIIVLNFLEIV